MFKRKRLARDEDDADVIQRKTADLETEIQAAVERLKSAQAAVDEANDDLRRTERERDAGFATEADVASAARDAAAAEARVVDCRRELDEGIRRREFMDRAARRLAQERRREEELKPEFTSALRRVSEKLNEMAADVDTLRRLRLEIISTYDDAIRAFGWPTRDGSSVLGVAMPVFALFDGADDGAGPTAAVHKINQVVADGF